MSNADNEVDNIFSSFRVKVLKTKFLPSTMTDMDLIIKNRKKWEKLQERLEFFYEWILLASFVSVFLNSQIITGLFIAFVGGISRTISNCKAKREELTNNLNVYIKRFGFDSLVFDDSPLANDQPEIKSSINEILPSDGFISKTNSLVINSEHKESTSNV